jgi:hypothetical protein
METLFKISSQIQYRHLNHSQDILHFRISGILPASILMWHGRLACPYFFLLEEQARRLYHTLLIKNAGVPF